MQIKSIVTQLYNNFSKKIDRTTRKTNYTLINCYRYCWVISISTLSFEINETGGNSGTWRKTKYIKNKYYDYYYIWKSNKNIYNYTVWTWINASNQPWGVSRIGQNNKTIETKRYNPLWSASGNDCSLKTKSRSSLSPLTHVVFISNSTLFEPHSMIMTNL